jgi:hypothetical protein
VFWRQCFGGGGVPGWSVLINDTNARILLPNGKSKVLNAMRLKRFFASPSDTNSENDTTSDNLFSIKIISDLFSDKTFFALIRAFSFKIKLTSSLFLLEQYP